MNTKLLKIIDDLGWTHEEQGKASIWFDKEFSLDAIQNEIQTFKELFEKDIEGYTFVRNLEKVRDSFEVEWNTSVYRIAENLINRRENKLKFIK